MITLKIDNGEPCVSLAEVQAYVRVETGEEEALLAGLIRVSTENCESFIGQRLMARSFVMRAVGASSGWTLLNLQPIRAVSAIKSDDGIAVPTELYQVDVDHDGRCWIRGLTSGGIYNIEGSAGFADTPNDVPESLRQGIVRLAAHFFASRDSAAGDIPAAVTALWRPYRKASLLS